MLDTIDHFPFLASPLLKKWIQYSDNKKGKQPFQIMGVRVAGVLERSKQILLVEHKKAGHSSWLLPGGRIEPGERAADALARELEEELCLQTRVGDLLFVVETVSPGSEWCLQPTYRIETDTIDALAVGDNPRVVGYRFFDCRGLMKTTLYPDLGDELAFYMENGEIPHRYLFKPWVD
jgi:ADP-ribose pyrophosphatase YjhB (NUDIX family)